MKLQDQRCIYLFSTLHLCSEFFIVVSLIVFMSLYEFCDFFLLDMCARLFVLRLFFLMHIAFVLFLKRFVSSVFISCFFPEL